MSKYQVKFYKGTYAQRQRAANADKAKIYIEQHFNSVNEKSNYTLANVATNAGAQSKAIAQSYVDRCSEAFGVPKANNDFAKNGVSVGGAGKRGNANLLLTNMPAVLLEPLFVSNPKHAEIVRSEAGRQRLAQILADTIIEFLPVGGLVAFSVGHKYKPAPKDKDRGAPVYGGGTEADFAEDVLIRAKAILESV